MATLSETQELLAVNLASGAHHSDLRRVAPDPAVDTPDVTQAIADITAILTRWIAQFSA